MIDATSDPLPRLEQRATHSHKGDYGRGLIIGGSLAMAGAPAMTAMACLRSGAGLVSVATPRCVQAIVASFHPAYTTHPLADDGECATAQAAETLSALASSANAMAIGPGLGRTAGVERLVADLWESPLPAVIDADGLNALAARRGSLSKPSAPRVLTPHAGEFARLAGEPLSDPDDTELRIVGAARLAKALGCNWSGEGSVVLLKGPATVVTDGSRYSVNPTGNPGMATGGSGDVLTGVILAMLCQGLGPFDAARLGAYIHGLAGDLAAAKLGQTSVMATDLIDFLPEAWRTHSTL